MFASRTTTLVKAIQPARFAHQTAVLRSAVIAEPSATTTRLSRRAPLSLPEDLRPRKDGTTGKWLRPRLSARKAAEIRKNCLLIAGDPDYEHRT